MAPRKPKLGIKSGPERIYEYLLDKPIGYQISDATHHDHIPLHAGTIGASLFGLEKQGVVRAVGKIRHRSQGSSRRMLITVFEWLGPKDDVRFRAGHRPGHVRVGGRGGASQPRRKLDVLGSTELTDRTATPADVRAVAQQTLAPKPQPHPETAPVTVLPPQPTLSEQILLLAIRIDRTRRPGTPSGVFGSPVTNNPRDLALPRRSEVVEKLLELATLAEHLESEVRTQLNALEERSAVRDEWNY